MSVVIRIFICIRITTRVPLYQDHPKQTKHANRSLSRASLNRSRGCSSFRGHHRPENSHAPSILLSWITTQPFLGQLLSL